MRINSALRIFSRTSANLPRAPVKLISFSAANSTISMSDSAMVSQSAGFFESVFLGKANSFSQDGFVKEISNAPLFRQPFRCNWHNRQRRFGANGPNGPAVTLRGFQLSARTIRYDTEIDIAIRSSVPSCVRTEKIHCPERHHAVHRFEASRQRFTLRRKACR